MRVRATALSKQPPDQHEALVHPRHQPSRDHERYHGAETSGGEHEAGRPRVVAEHLLGVQRDQEHARVHPKTDQRDGQGAEREVPIIEDSEVENRLRGHQFAHDEAGQEEDGQDSRAA